MSIRRICGRALVLAAIYAFALQAVLAAALVAAHAASGPQRPAPVLCSGAAVHAGAGDPAGNRPPGCAHCVMAGCGSQHANAPAVGEYLSIVFPAVAAKFVPAGDARHALPALVDRRFARAPPQA